VWVCSVLGGVDVQLIGSQRVCDDLVLLHRSCVDLMVLAWLLDYALVVQITRISTRLVVNENIL
jgi:hypothetical protein